MFGNLNKKQIDELLKENMVGRLGFYGDGKSYIIPLNYTYDGQNIYGLTRQGRKLEIIRKNPKVCFEIDVQKDTCNWQSVLLWGTFKELITENEKAEAFNIIFTRQRPLIASTITHTSPTWPFIENDFSKLEGVIFKIEPEEATGKFENCSNAPLFY